MRRWYSLKLGWSASWNATAFAAITCSRGPPWMPGKICELRTFACASRVRMSPPRGPRSVLCVVVVTISACGTGFGWSPAATRPAMWAMSTTNAAPTSRAISANRSKSAARVGARPDDEDLGPVLAGEAQDLVMSMVSSSCLRPYGTIL